MNEFKHNFMQNVRRLAGELEDIETIVLAASIFAGQGEFVYAMPKAVEQCGIKYSKEILNTGKIQNEYRSDILDIFNGSLLKLKHDLPFNIRLEDSFESWFENLPGVIGTIIFKSADCQFEHDIEKCNLHNICDRASSCMTECNNRKREEQNGCAIREYAGMGLHICKWNGAACADPNSCVNRAKSKE